MNKLGNIDSSKNAYFKDDERFMNSIFDTMEFYNEVTKKQDETRNKAVLKSYEARMKKAQQEYEELAKEI